MKCHVSRAHPTLFPLLLLCKNQRPRNLSIVFKSILFPPEKHHRTKVNHSINSPLSYLGFQRSEHKIIRVTIIDIQVYLSYAASTQKRYSYQFNINSISMLSSSRVDQCFLQWCPIKSQGKVMPGELTRTLKGKSYRSDFIRRSLCI